jgi:hypothetical protein
MSLVNAALPDRLMPRAAELGLRPFWGDIHNHSDLSYGHGSFPDALKKAALQLDFVSITGHAHWPDMPVDDPSVAHIVDFHIKGFEKLRRAWPGHYEVLRAANEPGHFTVFAGYEIHSFADGDYTIVLADLDGGPLCLEDTPAAVKKALRAQYGDRAFAFPHHIGYRQGARGINWATFDPDLSPVVEMLSMHGCAEASEDPRGYLHSMGPVDGHSTMVHGLAAGHRFGIVGNTDHHSGFPGSYGHGRMALYAPSHDRDAFWAAIAARRTGAQTGDRIHLLGEISGAVQGGEIAPQDDAEIAIEAVAGGAIDCIDVIRNGRLSHRISPAITPAPIGDDGETLIHLEMGWGARGQEPHWTGQIDLDGGEMLAVEPRFRGPEIVSPLEGEDSGAPIPEIHADGGGRALLGDRRGQPQQHDAGDAGLMIRAALTPTPRSAPRSAVRTSRSRPPGSMTERKAAISARSTARPGDFTRCRGCPDWQWQGRVPPRSACGGGHDLSALRQLSGQMAWTSPIFVR